MESDPAEVKFEQRNMSSVHQTKNVELRTPNIEQRWERFERKFFVSPEKTAFARILLSHICLRDSKYPQGRINSLYFDTPDLDNFQKSDDGSYEREKIRIRWYDGSNKHNGVVPVYLELKSKRGFASRKQRRQILVPAERLNKIRFNNTIINRNLILQTLSEFGYFSQDSLLPVILITYERFRFVDTLTSTRLSFDWKVSSMLTAPGIGYSEAQLILQGGIIEIKGPSM
ncbi:MAG: hypothetical protein A2173_07860, partial [Planctomycetes bacterium RBG_13_44_8b]